MVSATNSDGLQRGQRATTLNECTVTKTNRNLNLVRQLEVFLDRKEEGSSEKN